MGVYVVYVPGGRQTFNSEIFPIAAFGGIVVLVFRVFSVLNTGTDESKISVVNVLETLEALYNSFLYRPDRMRKPLFSP